MAKQNDIIKKIITESHKLDDGIEVETFALALATLRDRKEDDTPYLELAE